MEAIAALLFLFLFLFAFFNPLFFPPSKLLPWIHSLLLSPHPKSPKTQTTQKKEELELGTVFATFDADGDGFISKGELAESLWRLGLTATVGEVTSMMEKADANGDGLIDLDEFKKLSLSWGLSGRGGGGGGEYEEEGELRDAFAVFDGNGDGMITMEELRLVLKSLGMKEGERVEACRNMIKKVDMDGDGMINYEEFKNMMMVKEGKIF
ncbi:calmodulin-like protein 7 [Phalaenopsis equestris]|uniref:calmodulin-like protein 7 n=1 Tax=Phalaenopsis equestris TaxID=78828 RepID=UPI0009E265B4|nr:calmodulin-like protein 7 [Phalaenopsis equestris]